MDSVCCLVLFYPFPRQFDWVSHKFMCPEDMWGVDWLWLFAEQRLDEAQGGLVQLLQLLLRVAHIELGNVEKRLLLVFAQERRDSCQHHVGQDTNTPKHTTWSTAQAGLGGLIWKHGQNPQRINDILYTKMCIFDPYW